MESLLLGKLWESEGGEHCFPEKPTHLNLPSHDMKNFLSEKVF